MTGLEIIPIMISSLATNALAANILYLGTYAAMYGNCRGGVYFGAERI